VRGEFSSIIAEKDVHHDKRLKTCGKPPALCMKFSRPPFHFKV
jgi:hypothetical protein